MPFSPVSFRHLRLPSLKGLTPSITPRNAPPPPVPGVNDALVLGSGRTVGDATTRIPQVQHHLARALTLFTEPVPGQNEDARAKALGARVPALHRQLAAARAIAEGIPDASVLVAMIDDILLNSQNGGAWVRSDGHANHLRVSDPDALEKALFDAFDMACTLRPGI